MQFDASGDFSVVLHQIFVFVGVDHIFDGVGEIGEAHVAFAQPAPQRGEVVGVADFPVGAALGLEVDRVQHGVSVYRAGRHIGGLVDAGEACHPRPAQVQAAVVGEVVAEGDHGRPGRAVQALDRWIVGIAIRVDMRINIAGGERELCLTGSPGAGKTCINIAGGERELCSFVTSFAVAIIAVA